MTARNRLFSNDGLVTQAGEIDQLFIARAATARAEHRYGLDCTSLDIARYVDELKGVAQILRQRWRAEHGLPDDQTYTMIEPFGRQRDGVRWSAF